MASTVGDGVAPGRAERSARPGVWLTDFLLVLMAVIWGLNYISVKFATRMLAPLAFNGARVALAAVALVAIVAAARLAWPSRRDALALLALGVLGNGIYQVFFVEGAARTGASETALVMSAGPAFIAAIGALRGVERVGRRAIFGIVLSIAGIALVVTGASASASDAAGRSSSLVGDLLCLAGSLCWAVYTVFLTPYTERIDGLTLSALTMVGGAVPLVALGLPDILRTDWSAVSPAGWGAILYSGLLALVVAYLFWYRGVRVIGPTRTAMYGNLQPIVAVIAGWIAFGELLAPGQLVGGACILLGLLLTRT